MSGTSSLLSLKSLSKKFYGIPALQDLTLDIKAGEIHAVCGENGAGKSTLMKLLAGCHPHGSYEGEILLDGKAVHFKNPRQAEDQGIALIAQELALVPELSIAENIFLGREPRKTWRLDWAAMKQRAAEAMKQVGLEAEPMQRVGDLSVGKQQLVEIAKALSKKARALILDEPTSALTETDTRRLLALVKELAAKGVACLYVSHRLEEVLAIAGRITVLRDGKLAVSGPARGFTRDKLVGAMVGRKVTTLYPRTTGGRGASLLKVENFGLELPGGKQVLKDISFDLKQGEVLGIAGLMGSGRTALLSSLFGCGRGKVSGRLKLAGMASAGPCGSPSQALELGLCLVSEDRKKQGLVIEASLLENLGLAVFGRYARNGVLRWKDLKQACQGQMKGLGIKATGLDAPATSLSGGNQQKVVLGKWFLAGPKILLLDEPTRGIDVGAKAEIYALIHGWAKQGLGVILVSSELPEVMGLSNRILVLSQGRQTALLDARKTSAEKVMHAATL